MDGAGRGELAAALRRLRAAAGLTQEALAERAGVSGRTVSDIERGLRLSVYTDTARRLARALDPSDAGATRIEDLLRGRSGDGPPTAAGVPPVAPTPILGRASELAAVARALTTSSVRLLTLTGAGGIGKTRLALEASRQLRSAFPAGVFFVELGDVHDPELVAPAMARALGIVEAGAHVEGVIRQELSTKRALVVLDTFEHLSDAGVLIASLLQAGVEARFLVTSRRPLRVRGEFEFPVPPLDVPSALGTDATRDLAESPATALFIERALAVDPHLVIDASSAPYVLDICRKVNGVPLAIELAATRVKHLPLSALAAELDHRLDVLTGGPSDLPARQRAMRETVGWSHDLLTPSAKVLFRRLAVFSGGADISAMNAVCAVDPVADLLPDVSALVDHSLATLASVSGEARYDMLDVIHEYAAERLADAGEHGATAERHAMYFLRLAEQAEPNLVRAEQDKWVRRLDSERGNLRAAIAWTIAHDRTVPALRFTVALWRYWRHTGELAEGRRWSEATLRLTGVADDGLRAKALWATAFIAFPQGDYARMAELAAVDLEIARRGSDQMDLRNALTIVGQVAMCEGRYRDALDPFRESLAICARLGPSWHLGTSHLNLGNALLHSGDLEAAERAYASGLQVYREIGDETFAARMSVVLAQTALAREDVETAERLARPALAAFVSRNERLGIAEALDVMAAVAAARHELERSARLDAAAQRLQATIASRPAPFERAITRSLIDLGRRSAEAERWRRAWDDGYALALDDAIGEALRPATVVS